MNKEKLYKLTCETKWTSENGKENISDEIIIGYYVGEEEKYFYGSCFGFENGRWYGGDTVEMSKADFDSWEKKVEEIA